MLVFICSPPRASKFGLSVNDCVLVLVDLRRKSLLASLAGVGCAAVTLSIVAVKDNILILFLLVDQIWLPVQTP